MILKWLWELLTVIVTAAVSLFPNWTPPTNPGSGWSALQAANIVLPLDVFSVCAGGTVAVLGTGLLIWVVMKAVNLIRGSGA